MAVRKITQEGAGVEDLLGLVTFGSLIANIVQIVQGKTLEDKHEALEKYVSALNRRYQEAIKHNKQISDAYLSLKQVNEALARQVHTLEDIATALRSENVALKIELAALKEGNMKHKPSKAESPARKKRSVKGK